MKVDCVNEEELRLMWEMKQAGMDFAKVIKTALKWLDQGMTQAELMQPEKLERMRVIGRGGGS